MYRLIKQIVNIIVPKKLIFLVEPKLRAILYLFYRGETYQCNICNKKLRKYVIIETGEKLCPYCGSLPRTRRLWQLLNTEYLKNDTRILDFSPSRSLFRVLKQKDTINYESTDLSGDFLSDFHFDITNITVKDNTYDLIICYHILEHIEDDDKAIKELFRILKQNGTCLIQTPFKPGDIYEDINVKTETERLKHFGQKDHVRIYSIDGLKKRLENNGFRIEVKQFTDADENQYGFSSNEHVIICKK